MSLKSAKNLIRDLKRQGYQAYLVGGVVRDFLMKAKFSDIDITTNAKPFEVMKHFKAVPTGIKYGTITILYDNLSFEVTTFRTDGPTSDFRHPDSVIYSDNVHDDVTRRDFTMNGILMDEYQNVYDYVGGQRDIENKIIRAIGEPITRFKEDALRILRALYFQSKLGFEIESGTKDAMAQEKHLVKELAMERIHAELIKILKGPHLKKALNTMIETGIHKVLPGLEKGIVHIAKLEEMPFIDTFFATAFTLNDGFIPSKWTFSNRHRNKYQKASELALKHPNIIPDQALYHYGLEISLLANKVNFNLGKQTYQNQSIQERFKNLPLQSELDLALTSQDIIDLKDKKAGAWLGKLKTDMVNQILDKKISNTKEVLTAYVKAYEV
jgi:tRNA nucleotidyltransferase (CCA-adding enzyme)